MNNAQMAALNWAVQQAEAWGGQYSGDPRYEEHMAKVEKAKEALKEIRFMRQDAKIRKRLGSAT